ncbi:Alkaline and neutral invertase [Flavobacteriaceae bacterium MAR_2010_188]|nr:Alkaline and neutral invertase [Flavobacteriaceae bacterium MAR_2010_188]
MIEIDSLYQDSLTLLGSLSTHKGIMASTIDSDNYKRVWARDSVVCGIAGLISDQTLVVISLKNSLLALARNQHKSGMIPSNVLESFEATEVSYGSLVGRIDSNPWFIIGCCLYYKKTKDQNFWDEVLPKILNTVEFLNATEYNGKGWIYTPLSGNWADEYPIHGYTLYDNCLNIWAKSLLAKVLQTKDESLGKLKSKTYANFWPTIGSKEDSIYQKANFDLTIAKNLNHFCAFILPGIYDERFDAAANALACLNFNLNTSQKMSLAKFVDGLDAEIGLPLIPAFWPVINETDQDYFLLKGNYSFEFKNTAHNFHNGGIWPVWMGLFCLGLARQGLHSTVEKIVAGFLQTVEMGDWDFNEYINSDSLRLAGKEQMGYTASGIVFMKHALQFDKVKDTLGL